MQFCAVVVAAGTGSRAGGGDAKQWRLLAGKPVVRWSVEALTEAGADPVAVVVPAGDQQIAAAALTGLPIRLVAGGTTRGASVRAGLGALTDGPNVVLVHDAARPLLGADLIERLLDALATADGALPALPVADTLKRLDGPQLSTVSRDGLWRAQTPQAFRRSTLVEAYAAWPPGEEPTDDAGVVERAGGHVVMIPGDPRLLKLTYPEDFIVAEALAAARVTCIGQGFDAHRFGPGEQVWLCGVCIPHDLGLVGHSDADVGLHALVDAILGAIGAGDIGDHFPPTDPRWKGAASHLFLTHAAELARSRGARLANVDVTLICEAPRIKPHREAMRAKLAELLDLPLGRVSVKATTTEGMGFTGRSEGIAAQAVVALDLPAA